MATDDRPLITCAGNQSLFASVHPHIVDALALQKTEWQRSYGRPVRKVRLCGHFVPFDVHQLPRKFDENRLLKDPVLHLYWIDCDIETYKRKVHDDLFMWWSALRALSIPDWLIIVVEHEENKVKNKILRTSVFDKVKSEFGSRSSNRCIIFSDPTRNDLKSEAWTSVISRVKELMLASFSRTISKFEDAMRLERERRIQPDWTFAKYFMLQESLAKFYNVIELYEDALVQYDELDALFAQFVVNHSVGDKADWLLPYGELASGWEGVSMSTDVNLYRRMLISEGKPSLLDLRNYMFSSQCDLLIQLERPSELTDRSLKFIHNTIHELRLLEVDMPPGAVSCWVFLTCKELLSVCETFKEYLDIEIYSIYTSHLWTCLQSVTYKLGCLCGLMPGSSPTSQELHSVVQLISGISNGSNYNNALTPQHRLKRVLSSSQEFCSYYVELTEMTICTLKYIKHTRMAKVLGLQLAKFYMASKKPQQAEPFLLSCLQLFTNDQWTSLEVDTWNQLALCEQMMGHSSAYVRASLKVASHSRASSDLRVSCMQRITDFALSNKEVVVVVEDCALSLLSVSVQNDSQSNAATLQVQVEFKLPVSLEYDTLSLLIKPHVPGETNSDKSKSSQKGRSSFAAVQLAPFYDRKQEDGSVSVGLDCVNPHSLLTHKDSHNTGHMIRNLSKNKVEQTDSEQEMVASICSGSLNPGRNKLTFLLQEPRMGEFRVHQIRLQKSSIDLYSNVPGGAFSIRTSTPPKVKIEFGDQPICFLGMTNSLTAQVSSEDVDGKLPSVTSSQANVSVHSSTESPTTLRFQFQPTTKSITPSSQLLPVKFSFESTPHYTLPAETLLISQTIECCCPIEISSKVYTAREQKFIQIAVFSLVEGQDISIRHPSLEVTQQSDCGLEFTSLNGPDNALWTLKQSSQLSFLWRLKTDAVITDSVKCSFSLQFQEKMDETLTDDFYTFSTEVSIDIVLTQFIMTRYIKSGIPMSPLSISRQTSTEQASPFSPDTLSSELKPNTWQALCECEMVVELKSCSDLQPYEGEGHSQQMSYEIRSDPNWAISGSKHGLLELDSHTLCSTISVRLMPLTNGFLCMPEVKLRNANDEEFLPGQVYDNSKLSQVFISNNES